MLLQTTLKRLFISIPLSLILVVTVGLIIHLIPGEPTDIILGDLATLKEKEDLKISLGLNQPISFQIIEYVKNVLTGNFGISLIHREPVLSLILERCIPTAELSLWAMIFALLLSFPTGVLCALFRSSLLDHFGRVFSLLGVATPNFWLGPLLIYIFSIQLQLLPVSERTDFLSFILPAITLGTSLAAFLSRIIRNSLIETLTEEYIITARAKGLKSFQILFKHALKNAALPILTVIGLQFGVLLTGTIITEQIFDWPGLGTLIIQALRERDYPLIQGCVLFFAFIYLIINMLTDLSYAILDPRTQNER